MPLKNIFIQLSIEGDFHVPTGGKCLPELFGIVGNGHIDKLFLAAAGTQQLSLRIHQTTLPVECVRLLPPHAVDTQHIDLIFALARSRIRQ